LWNPNLVTNKYCPDWLHTELVQYLENVYNLTV